MIPLKLKVDGVEKDLWQIMDPEGQYGPTLEDKIAYAIEHHMFPTSVDLSSEVYSRDAERTANYELEVLTLVNAKSKPEFTWEYLDVVYAKRLLDFCKFKYNFKDANGDIQPEEAAVIEVTYQDFNGMRTIKAYLGQSINGTLKEIVTQKQNASTGQYETVRKQYWESFRISFPER